MVIHPGILSGIFSEVPLENSQEIILEVPQRIFPEALPRITLHFLDLSSQILSEVSPVMLQKAIQRFSQQFMQKILQNLFLGIFK